MTGQPGSDRGGASEANTDPVTGAFSRGLLDSRLAAELERAARAGGECSLFLFDVDYFKSVNDAYGHAHGDRVLRQLVERITTLVRGGDVLFRYGGDEFVLLLPDTGKVDAVEVALRVVEGVRATPLSGDPPLSVSISLGVATFPADGKDAAELLGAADRRSYLAKRRGRACAVADDEPDGGRAAYYRLLERDTALATAQGFLNRLIAEGRGALRVRGERGVGHSRFLAEVGKIARLRGLRVIGLEGAAGSGAAIGRGAGDAAGRGAGDAAGRGAGDAAGRVSGVLILADSEAGWPDATELLHELSAAEPPPIVLGLVYASPGRAGDPPGLGLPVLDTVELAPWSSSALRAWLRTALRGEPSPALVNWLAGHSGGLPARAEQELSRLIDRAGLERTGSGGWTLAAPVLAAATRSRARLPTPLTELFGRHRETAQVAELLADRRLVTLVGPGGIGKTRLALAVATLVADSYDDGAVFVSLTEATTAETAISTLARALEVGEVPVNGVSGQPLAESIAKQLAEKSMLLVLDNFEQVLAAAPMVAELLAAAPAVTVLATSRERLRLSVEQVYPVPPLGLPDLAALPGGPDGPSRAVADSPALALFADRAKAVAYEFALTAENLRATAELCHRLDGLPLAIELAAARCDEFRPEELLAQLNTKIDVLAEGPRDLPSRQQTLRATIEWSAGLLDPATRGLLVRLGVFSGGCTLAAAAAICTAPDQSAAAPDALPDALPDPLPDALAGTQALLGALVDKNLLRVETPVPLVPDIDPEFGTRYLPLETIRTYAAERLAARGEVVELRARHARYYADLAERAGRELIGPGQAAWLGRIERDYPNLRAALAWALETGAAATAGRLAIGLWRFWRSGSHLTDGREWLDRVLSTPAVGPALPAAKRADVLHAAGFLAAVTSDLGRAEILARESLAVARELGDRAAMARALNVLGIAALIGGDYEQSRAYHTEQLKLAQVEGDRLGTAMARGNLTKLALRLGDLDTAHALAVRNLELEREIGNTRGVALTLECLGGVFIRRGEPATARPLLEESLAISRVLADVLCEARALHQLGLAAAQEGAAAEAARLISAAVALQRDAGQRDELAVSLEDLARIAAPAHPELAARLFAATAELRDRYRLPRPPARQGDWEASVAGLRDRLGEQGTAAAWTAGRLTPLEATVEEVLALDPASFTRG